MLDSEDPEMEIMNIERKLKFYAQQKVQFNAAKQEYKKLSEQLNYFISINDHNEVVKIQSKLQGLSQQVKDYMKHRESHVNEVKALQARIEELKQMTS